MRTGFRWIISILFVLLLPVWLLLLVPKLNGFGPEPLKQQLGAHEVYEQLSQLLQQAPTETEDGGEEVTTDQALLVFRSALTPTYIESKANEVIDESGAWLAGQTEAAPAVSFNDIRDTVLQSYPDAQVQIEELQQQLQAAQQDIQNQPIDPDGLPGLEGDGSTSPTELAEMLEQANSLDNFISGDFSVELGNALEPLRQAYTAYWYALPILGLVLLLFIIVMIWLGNSWPSRLRWLGWVLIVSGKYNLLLAVIFSVVILQIGLDAAVGMVPVQAEAATSAAKAVAAALFADYMQIQLVMSGVLLVIGVTLILTSIIMKRRATSAVTQTTDTITPSEIKPALADPTPSPPPTKPTAKPSDSKAS